MKSDAIELDSRARGVNSTLQKVDKILNTLASPK